MLSVSPSLSSCISVNDSHFVICNIYIYNNNICIHVLDNYWLKSSCKVEQLPRWMINIFRIFVTACVCVFSLPYCRTLSMEAFH